MSQDCIFCRIGRGEIPSTKVYEDEQVFVIKDINPKAPVHLLVIPRTHLATFDDLTPAHAALDAAMVGAVQEAARSSGIAGAYRVAVNCGAQAGQVVFHLHWHVLGGWSKAQSD